MHLKTNKYIASGGLLSKILLTLGVVYCFWNYPVTNSSQKLAMAATVPDFLVEQPKATSSESTTLPVPIQTAVLEKAARRTSRTVAEFRVLNAQRRNWSDGCLGISQPDELCTQVITPGWQVIVTDGRRNWVYRTNALGTNVKLAEAP